MIMLSLPEPEAVPEVQITGTDLTNMNITWSVLSEKEARGVIVQYDIMYKLKDDSYQHEHILESPVTHYTLKGVCVCS